ncbi:MAG: M20 family metallopeptidase [Armatimonadota bacterium]
MSLKFDFDYLTDLHGRLVSIPSGSKNEEEVMLFLEREFERQGLPSSRIHVSDDRFNLLVRIGQGAPVLCLNAHADTVPENGASVPLARIEDGRMYGLGSVDDKASVAAMILAVKAIAESGIELTGTLDLLISVDEEWDAQGVKVTVEQGYTCDMAITGEPTGLDIVRAHCGVMFLDIITHGKSAHGSSPGFGENAIALMNEVVYGLLPVVEAYPPHPLIGLPSLNLGMINAGDRPNRVPDRCEASVDIRIVPPMTVNSMLENIDAYFEQWGDRASYTVSRYGNTLDTRDDSPLIAALSSGREKVHGVTPSVIGWRGWTEAESFSTLLDVDAVVLGPGSLDQAHSADEYVELDQVRLAAQIYAEAALKIIGPEIIAVE